RPRMLQHQAPVGLAPRHAVIPNIAEQVDHDRGLVLVSAPQWQLREHANLLLELRCHTGVDAVVPAVVRPWRELVHEESIIVENKHLDAKHAAVIERFGHGKRDASAVFGETRRDTRRDYADIENAMSMAVVSH